MGDPMKLRRISISSLQEGHVGAVVKMCTDVGSRCPIVLEQSKVENANDNNVATPHTSCDVSSVPCTYVIRHVYPIAIRAWLVAGGDATFVLNLGDFVKTPIQNGIRFCETWPLCGPL